MAEVIVDTSALIAFFVGSDCSILVMSQKLGIPEVFAFDEHIRQMAGLGIRCVPQNEGR